MARSTVRSIAFILAMACIFVRQPSTASAHGADANSGDVRLAGDTAYAVVWPPSEVFSEFDDNADGLIQRSETRVHRTAMLELLRANFLLEDEEGNVGETIFEDLSTPVHNVEDPAAGAVHLRVTLRRRWPQPPRSLVLRYTLIGSNPMTIRAVRVTATKAVHDQKPLEPMKISVFDESRMRHTLLAPLPATDEGVGRAPSR